MATAPCPFTVMRLRISTPAIMRLHQSRHLGARDNELRVGRRLWALAWPFALKLRPVAAAGKMELFPNKRLPRADDYKRR